GGVVNKIAAGNDFLQVPGVSLRIQRHHHIDVAGARTVIAVRDPNLVPGRRALNIGRKIILADHGHAAAEDGLHQQSVGARRTGTVDGRDLDGEVVYAVGWGCGWHACFMSPACGQYTVDFCMSQAAVGQRSAHNPQCTQRFSSLTITRPVCFSAADTYSGWSGLVAGARRCCRSSASSPLAVMVRQSTGQMSMHASHSMHSLASKTV